MGVVEHATQFISTRGDFERCCESKHSRKWLIIVVSRLGLEPRTLALKARKDQNINGLILRRFPRFFFANKDLR